jgi:hypothetical protein
MDTAAACWLASAKLINMAARLQQQHAETQRQRLQQLRVFLAKRSSLVV